MDSILSSIKQLLGASDDYTHFDKEIIMHINSVFMILNQLGVGPSTSFRIVDKDNLWNDFLQNDETIEAVKTYMFLKVKLVFDPPASSIVTASMERQIVELEWRLNVKADIGG